MKILIVDDHALFREGLVWVLKQLPQPADVVAANDGAQAIGFVKEQGPFDLVLLDMNLPGSSGLAIMQDLQPLLTCPIAFLSAERDARRIGEALRAGARGFITKTSNSQVMLSAVNLILSGGTYIPPEMLQLEPQDATTPDAQDPLDEQPHEKTKPFNAEHAPNLTDRQRAVLMLMAQGLSNKEIGRDLNMSPGTVKVHVAAVLRELNVANRTQAVKHAMERGWCRPVAH